jgi:hypothetical protein
MSETTGLIIILTVILLLNLPFGFWRAGVKKFSLQWYLAVHVPVLLAIALRIWEHLAFRLATLPLFVAAFFMGQVLGGKLRGKRI